MFLEWENNSGKLKIISGKFQNSGEFQNNAINDVKQISLSHVIIAKIRLYFCPDRLNGIYLCAISYRSFEIIHLLRKTFAKGTQ